MHGRTVLVTGGNTGVGKATAVALAAAGADVVFTSRDAAKGATALADVRERSGSSSVEVMELDLARFASVRDFAERFTSEHERLDVLVNNAGVMLSTRSETEDGNETTLQVNHLSPFLLTLSLRDVLVSAERARVINVASSLHHRARHGIDFDDLQSTRGYRGSDVYAKTKLMNILFTRELGRRWDAVEVGVNAVHPGFVASGFGKDGDTRGIEGIALRVLRPFAISPEKGARTQVYLASAPEISGLTRGYWEKCAPATPSRHAQDDDAASRLWEVSERLVG